MKPKLPDRFALTLAGCAAIALLTLAAPGVTLGQAAGGITPNYKDADLSQIIEAVSAVTGKNFIVDPRVRAQVTMLSSTPMSRGRVLRGLPLDPAGARLRRRPVRRRHQDHPRRQRPPAARQRPALARELDVGRDRHPGDRGQERERRPAGADPAAADPAVRPPRGLPGLEHADHLGPCLQRLAHGADHRAHRPDRRRRNRRHPDAARERHGSRAHREPALHHGRGRRRRHADREDGGGRTHQQRAGEWRALAAPAAQDAGHAPRHAARGRWRRAGALPALRGRREARDQASRADPGHRCGGRTGWRPAARRGAAARGGERGAAWTGA